MHLTTKRKTEAGIHTGATIIFALKHTCTYIIPQ